MKSIKGFWNSRHARYSGHFQEPLARVLEPIIHGVLWKTLAQEKTKLKTLPTDSGREISKSTSPQSAHPPHPTNTDKKCYLGCWGELSTNSLLLPLPFPSLLLLFNHSQQFISWNSINPCGKIFSPILYHHALAMILVTNRRKIPATRSVMVTT